MTRLSSLILLAATSLALAAPALAKTTIQQGESLCKAEAQKQHSPKSLRIDKDDLKATNQSFVFTLRMKGADDVAAKLSCKVDRETQAVVLTASE
jgi:siroheme synthase